MEASEDGAGFTDFEIGSAPGAEGAIGAAGGGGAASDAQGSSRATNWPPLTPNTKA